MNMRSGGRSKQAEAEKKHWETGVRLYLRATSDDATRATILDILRRAQPTNPMNGAEDMLGKIDHMPALRQWRLAWDSLPKEVLELVGGMRPGGPKDVVRMNHRILSDAPLMFEVAAPHSVCRSLLFVAKRDGFIARDLMIFLDRLPLNGETRAEQFARACEGHSRLVFAFLYATMFFYGTSMAVEVLDELGDERVQSDPLLAWLSDVTRKIDLHVRNFKIIEVGRLKGEDGREDGVQDEQHEVPGLSTESAKEPPIPQLPDEPVLAPAGGFDQGKRQLLQCIERLNAAEWPGSVDALIGAIRRLDEIASACQSDARLAEIRQMTRTAVVRLSEAIARFAAAQPDLAGGLDRTVPDTLDGLPAEMADRCRQLADGIAAWADAAVGQIALFDSATALMKNAPFGELASAMADVQRLHASVSLKSSALRRLYGAYCDALDGGPVGSPALAEVVRATPPAAAPVVATPPTPPVEPAPAAPLDAPSPVASPQVVIAPPTPPPGAEATAADDMKVEADDTLLTGAAANDQKLATEPDLDETAQNDITSERDAFDVLRSTFEAGEPGLALALARAIDLDRGEPLPGAPSLYALLAAAAAQNEVVPSSNAYLDEHLASAMACLARGTIVRADKPLVLAALAAAIRPALFDMLSGTAVAFLRELSHAQGIGNGVRSLAACAAKPMTVGLSDLRPELLATGYQASDAHRNERIRAHAARAQAILDRKDSECLRNFSSFPSGQVLYDRFLGEDHAIGRALRALVTRRPEAVGKAVAAARVELNQDRYTYIQECFRATGQPFKLVGAYYERLFTLLSALERFLATVELEVGTSAPADLARAASYAVELDAHLAVAANEIDALANGEADDLALAVRVLSSVIVSMRSLIATGSMPSRTTAIDHYLTRTLPLLDIDLGPDLSGSGASGYALGIEPGFKSDAALVRKLISEAEKPLPRAVDDYLAAASRHLDHGRMHSARRAIAIAQSEGAGRGDVKALQTRMEKMTGEARTKLSDEIARYRMRLNTLYAQGLLNDASRSELEAQLDLQQARLFDLPQLEPVSSADDLGQPHDLDEARSRLQAAVGGRLAAVHQQGCEALRADIDASGGRLAEPLRVHVQRVIEVLDRGHLDIARDYWAMLKAGQPLPEAGASTGWLDEFHKQFLTEAQGPAFSTIAGDAIRAFGGGPAMPYLTVSDAARAGDAADFVSDWLALFNGKGANQQVAKAVASFFAKHLGLSGLSVMPIGAGQLPMYRIEGMDLASAIGPDYFLLPVLGSQRSGTFTLVLVPHTQARHAISDAAGSADLVFVRRAIGGDERAVLYKQFRKAQRGAAVIDDALVVFSAAGRNRLARMLAIASTFCISHPYADDQNMPKEMFFGREASRQAIVNARAGVLVFGGRRLGKSSLLRDIERRNTNAAARRHYIYVDMVAATAEEYTKVLFSLIAQKLVDARILSKSVNRSSASAKILKEIADAVKQHNLQVTVLIDEADDLLKHESNANPRFPVLTDLIKLLKETDGRFRFAVAGLHNTERLARYANSVLDQMSDPVALTPFIDAERAAGLDLVVKPFAAMGFKFESQDMAYEIVSRAMFFPALIQVYCQSILTVAYAAGLEGLPPYTITHEHLRRVDLDGSLTRNLLEIFGKTLELDPRYRVITLTMAYRHLQAGSAGQFSMTLPALAELVKGFAPKLFPPTTELYVIDALCDELANLGVLIRVGEGREVQLRSISLLGRFGNRQEIDKALIEAEKTRLDHDDGEQRVNFSEGRPCPLSIRAIADLGQPNANKPPVRLVVASPATGAAELDRLGLDSGWLHGRATAVALRPARNDGRDIVEAACKPPLKPGRLTLDGLAAQQSRSLLVVAPTWPIAALQGLRHAADQIVAGDRAVALLVDPAQAAKLCEQPMPPFPVIAAGLWGVDAAHYYLRSVEREGILSETDLADLVKHCGHVPQIIRTVLADGRPVPTSVSEAAQRAGITLSRQGMLEFFGVPATAVALVADLAATDFTREGFMKHCATHASRCNGETLFELLVALGAIVAAGVETHALNPLLDEAMTLEG